MLIEDIVGHIPFEAGRIVGICRYENFIFVATEFRVYRLSPDPWGGEVRLEAITRAPPMPEPI
jgi:hypothetical protein